MTRSKAFGACSRQGKTATSGKCDVTLDKAMPIPALLHMIMSDDAIYALHLFSFAPMINMLIYIP